MNNTWFKPSAMTRRWLCCAAAFLGAGCHILPPLPNTVRDMGPRYHPTNVYRRANALPPQLRRVAVLPVTMSGSTEFLKAGVETLGPLVYAELEKAKRFEAIPVSPDDLRQWTGKLGWNTDEPLPPDFFARVAGATGCDAVLFCQLTRYAPYPPLALGWKFSLVAVPTSSHPSVNEMKESVFWAADELFDAGDSAVANAARDYYVQHLRNEAPSAESTTILSSPGRFGQYTLAALFETIPGRVAPSR